MLLYPTPNQHSQPYYNSIVTGLLDNISIYVKDMARGLMQCALKGKEGDVYNLASGRGNKIIDIAKLINEITGTNSKLILSPPRSWDRSGKRFASTEKAEKFINFKTRITMENGIKETIDWTKKNQDLIQSCINNHRVFIQNDEENFKFIKK